MEQPFSELVDAEVPDAGARGDAHVTGTRRNLAGIALSGGGIRSATFNLGLLQGLDDLGLLRGFDYLSTVSGGGYVGGFWTRWRSRRAAGDAGDFPPREEGVPCEDLRHLRRFSNFLTPRLGILSVDTGRAVVAVLGGTVPALLAAFSAGILAFAVWLAAGWALLARPFEDVLDGRIEAAAPFAVMALLTAAGLLGGEHVWRRTARDGRWGLYLWTAAVATAASAGVFGMVEASRDTADPLYAADHGLPLIARGASLADWIHLFAPALAWLAAAGVLVLRRFLVSSATRTLRHRERADAFDRTQSRLLLFAGVWSAAALVWILGAGGTATGAIGGGVAERFTGLAGTAAAAAALFAWIRKRADDTGPIQAGARLLARLGPLLPQVLAYLAVAAAAALNAAVFVAVGTARPDGVALLFNAALAVTLAVLLFMDPQEIGLHSFYRTRLVRAFLGASNADARFRSEEHDGDDVPLDALAGRGDGPVHLICCAANDLATDRLFENLQRGAVSGVLSPVGYSVGAEWARWSPEAETPSLGAAMTASAAAFNSLMGARTIQYGPAVTFLATALNLRLGMWLPHPRRIPPPPRKIPLVVPFVRESGASVPRRSVRVPRPRFPGSRFYREMFGLARADGRGPVHLSDGGHFENLGVYELIRRHCTFILASDCGQDAAVAFDDVGNLVRKVREDFGVDVRIDLSLLRPGPDGRAAQHMVAGDIHYPDGETGTLLLFKPSLAGGEPADVQQYASRNAVFPHESTGDQFYDEAQWEAYRSLGEHAVRVAFERLMGGLPPREAPRPRLAEAFARARFEWLTGTGFGERSAGLGKRIGELDAMLLTPGCAALRAEVFRELPEPAPAAPWSDEALPASLAAVRAALRMMEDAFRSEGLEREGSHPAYLPLLNHFGRWTSAPLLRAWWPVLRTLHGQPFARWLEATFGLRSPGGGPGDGDDDDLAEVALLPLDLRPTGFASRAWAASRPFPDAGDERIGLSYELRLEHGGGAHRVQAGLLLCHVRPGLIAWDADDFFVPPGLWGCGFGTDFMRRLARAASTPFLGDEVNAGGVLLARVPCDPEGSAEQRRRAANEVRMYRGSGFREALADDGMLVAAGGAELTLDMRDLPAAVLRSGTRWMVAERVGAAVAAPVP